MLTHLSYLLLVLTLFSTVSSFNIRPLRAGSIEITDSDIRSQQKFNRQIDLNMKTSYYSSIKGIKAIASITSLVMDDRLNFYFTYDISCPKETCFLNFTFIRKTQKMNPEIKYNLLVDYLIATGLRILQLNMTSYQQHLMLHDIDSYDQQGNKQNLGQKIPYNNYDAQRALLIPNGFSNLTRTGRVVWNYVMQTQMYVVHYMDHQRHSEADFQGWPQGADYILFKVVFVDAFYQPEPECKADDQWKLQGHYQKLCLGGSSDLTWFFGFKSTKSQQIAGQFFELRAGFSFSISKAEEYGLTAFPMLGSSEFQDTRDHEYKYERQYLMIGEAAGVILLIGLIAGAAFVSYKFVTKRIIKKKLRGSRPRYDEFHEEQVQKSGTSVVSPHQQI